MCAGLNFDGLVWYTGCEEHRPDTRERGQAMDGLGMGGGMGNIGMYMIFLAPAMLLGMWAQYRVKTTFAAGMQVPAPMTGAQAARRILDDAGLQNVQIEQIPGTLTDHYDPRDKVLRLSTDVYNGANAAAVGVAAHESGHAIQDATHYSLMTIRMIAVPLAGFGSKFSFALLALGAAMANPMLIWAGVALFGGVVFFQVVNLPVEFNASSRAKQRIAAMGLLSGAGQQQVATVLYSAALTYVAATLQAIATMLYYVVTLLGGRRNEN